MFNLFILGFILFFIALIGFFIYSQSIIMLLVFLELMYLAITMMLIYLYVYHGIYYTSIFILVVFTISTVETVTGLVLLMKYGQSDHTLINAHTE